LILTSTSFKENTTICDLHKKEKIKLCYTINAVYLYP
jgi:hypothetical protein